MTNHNSYPSAERRYAADEQLTPEAMLSRTQELFDGFPEVFPAVGEIGVEIDSDAIVFQSGKKGRAVYVPGREDASRMFYNPNYSKDGEGEIGSKDYATWMVQAFGKNVTIRMRGELPEPQDLNHKAVPRIVRELLREEIPEDDKQALLLELEAVVSTNMGVADSEAKETTTQAYLWMVDRIRSGLYPEE